MTEAIAVDTSVAIALLVDRHSAHQAAMAWWAQRPLVLAGHALAETYSVLTRLPADLRVTPQDAAAAISDWFGTPLQMHTRTARNLHVVFAEAGVAAGAVYDALVGLAARDNGRTLATRDARALPTYDRLQVSVELVPS